MKVLIIGGVAGGASAAARLRRLDEKAEIIIFERGEYISYANCGLPYFIGGEIKNQAALLLQTPQSFKARFNIDVRVKNDVVEIDSKSKTITVRDLSDGSEYIESYDKLVLSPGAEPVKPPIPGINSDKVFTLRNIPDTIKIKSYIENSHPKTAVITGGGYIGVEMAENLKKAGLDVTVIELADHLIGALDFDMAADVHSYIAESGIKLLLNSGVKEITEKDEGLDIAVSTASGDKTIGADMLIMSVGVRPDTALAKKAKITANAHGSIITDSHMKTSIPDIYAVGDAIEVNNFITGKSAFIPLAGPANKQGRIAADNICGIESEYNGTQGSSVLKLFDMTIGTTGINESSAKNSGLAYDKTYIYSGSHAGYYPGAKNMSIKVIWDKDSKKLLGAQIVGFDGVDKRMDVLATAIRFEAKITDLTTLELCYAPPFGSAKDPVNMAGYVAENVISRKVKQFFWHDVAKLPRDGSVTLLDVRTVAEFENGHIGGFINIPVDVLRSKLDQISKDKPVFVHCHSGLRSYIACRILSGNGYDCYNLAGGWRLYANIEKTLKSSGINKIEDYPCYSCR
ncbi:MAG: FAD-dependent oxidoreductase [Oscillospiraceae bacterium]|nr:FAD-dependent oxidoreductase [Oscillospiraceae bacterium]